MSETTKISMVDEQVMQDQYKKIKELEAELAGIDAVMARRPALDKPTRRENIEYAINTASRVSSVEHALEGCQTKCAELEKEIVHLQAIYTELHIDYMRLLGAPIQ